MLKFILIVILISYLFYRVGGFLYQVLFAGTARSQTNERHSHHDAHKSTRKPTSGNVNIDYVPRKEQGSRKKFKGGDYVDFEEVK